MSNKEINQLVETTLNPYLVFRAEILNTKEEFKLLNQLADKLLTDNFRSEFDNNCIQVDINYIKVV